VAATRFICSRRWRKHWRSWGSTTARARRRGRRSPSPRLRGSQRSRRRSRWRGRCSWRMGSSPRGRSARRSRGPWS
jgi:hypothetical protein